MLLSRSSSISRTTAFTCACRRASLSRSDEWRRRGCLLALFAVPHLLMAAPASDNDPATGLADSAALRATVFGTPPQDIAPMPATVPLQEIDISIPWARPVPKVLWFDSRL